MAGSAAGRAERVTALAAINAAAIIFGTVALFGKIDASPFWITAGRAGLAAAVLAVVARVLRPPLALRPDEAKRVLVTGALLAIHWSSFFAAVQLAGVAVGTLTFAAFPLFTILLQSARGRRVPTWIEVGTGVAIVAAVALLAQPGLPAAGPAVRLGAAIGLGSAACFAAFVLITQRLTKTVNVLALSLYQNAIVTVLLAPVLPFVSGPHGAPALLAIAVLGVVATALVHHFTCTG